MNIVEMQPAALPPTFPVSDTRPSQPATHLDHAHRAPQHADNRTTHKEGRPTATASGVPEETTLISPRSARDSNEQSNGAHVNGQLSPQSALAGKKRSANGEVKDTGSGASNLTNTGHSRSTSNVSNASSATVVEVRHIGNAACSYADMRQLSQQLRTRLTYAMIKVQNGWQNRSLDEVESLASASPRSTTFNHYSENSHLLSPRAAITAQLTRRSSDSSSNSDKQSSPRPNTVLMSPPSTRKALAPPANIVSRASQQRRRPPPNMQVQTAGQPPARPTVKHRTPSQSAAMEADAVETLLFMASPNNSGSAHHSSQFSPVTSAPSVHHFPSQTSPLRNTFSAPTSPKRVAFAANNGYAARYGHDKNAIVASMVEKLGDDGDADLDEALKLMDEHHATKITT
ncbi:hypothetical protein PMZ80_003086 [Knufia obscura]|uniref:Uncharacterized protein n=2 Tax=Knufia TaxID=430999 RepID=A0AAN8I242_9EURO|nr:hypothetical protein PMZ80_003086 [Knufia obscura]KAK5947899.1 hypothetical protein OHC33_011056 [Knufia fluminis]